MIMTVRESEKRFLSRVLVVVAAYRVMLNVSGELPIHIIVTALAMEKC